MSSGEHTFFILSWLILFPLFEGSFTMEDIRGAGPSASGIFPSDFMEQSFAEESDVARQLETPNEAFMVVEMIEKDLEDVYLKYKTIDDNLKRLKRYIEADKRRKSCGIMDIDNEFCREAIRIAVLEEPDGLSEESLVRVLKEFSISKKQTVISKYASTNVKKFRSQLLLIERHLMKMKQKRTGNVPPNLIKKVKNILDTIEEIIENTRE
ncbi:uncharacterized protein LOC129229858 [Uloborus diversus]|uniref:uncharacterized protein LOC129229858 n=1 Tax=Uloborus diversus TaxID=327109 RepID=UPI00240A94F8|nr:uncharacterized protein LOC129229858 [Uloborus diversus]